jgi:hypothetical protein
MLRPASSLLLRGDHAGSRHFPADAVDAKAVVNASPKIEMPEQIRECMVRDVRPDDRSFIEEIRKVCILLERALLEWLGRRHLQHGAGQISYLHPSTAA